MSNLNNEELSFFEEMEGVCPLSQDKVNAHDAARALAEKKIAAQRNKSQKEQRIPLSMNAVVPVAPDDFLTFKQSGIQDGVYKNLRLGKYALDVNVTLSGLTLDMAATALFNTIMDSHQKGYRAILIKHGKGENSQPFPAFKKSYVNHWLREIELVIAFHTAQPMHGGLGSTYVLLKKHPDQKLINRERNRKR